MVFFCYVEFLFLFEKMMIKMFDGIEMIVYGFGGYIFNDKKFKYIDCDFCELIN